MRLATGGYMLNFGYWDSRNTTPLESQQKLCELFAKISHLQPRQFVVDVGSGYGAPALYWKKAYPQTEIFSVNTNFEQLRQSFAAIPKLNASATSIPLCGESVDRVLSFESAQHFKPLSKFLSESFRILKKNGLLVIAIPVMTQDENSLKKLGLLSITWSSEHYSEDFVLSSIKKRGFEIISTSRIGSKVYVPMSEYYQNNRAQIREKILTMYPGYVEKILNKSMNKMKKVSQKNIIEYLLICCKKPVP